MAATKEAAEEAAPDLPLFSKPGGRPERKRRGNGGCQAEIGVGSAMGAAVAGEAQGANIKARSNAAESALEHHLEMTCDPVAGFVQVPCIERCAFGAVKAWTAYCIATNEIETKRRVDLDTCMNAMAMTAKDMNPKYQETSDSRLGVPGPLPGADLEKQ